MNSPLHVVVLSASPDNPSKTATLADIAAHEIAARHSGAQIATVNVYRIGTGLTSAIMRSDVDDKAERALETVEHADVLLAAVPVYRGSYPGMFKHFMDLLDQNALRRTPVILIATGGSDRHTLVVDHVMRPLFAFFHAYCAPTGIYASATDFDGATLTNPHIGQRISQAVDDIDPLLRAW